jgi:hypothetical protein
MDKHPRTRPRGCPFYPQEQTWSAWLVMSVKCHEETLRPQLITALSRVAIVFFKGCNDGVEFLDILASSGFKYWGYIDLIAKLTRARAKFPEVAYRTRPSFFAPGDLLIKATHGPFRRVMSAVKHVCPRDDAWQSTPAIIPELQL